MSQLSSHSLFHFTHNENTLKKILQNGVRYSPIGEVIPGTQFKYVVDAICFCNIPLSAISQHIDWYGEYGIGFKPEFCKRIGATPVLYAHSSSPFLCRNAKAAYYLQWNMTPYLKRNCGKQAKYNCHRFYWKDFYDEKEWRAVKTSALVLYDKQDVSNLSELKRLVDDEITARKTCDYSIEKFYWDDIDYIILPRKQDVTSFASWILGSKLPCSLLPKIITVEQIRKDY